MTEPILTKQTKLSTIAKDRPKSLRVAIPTTIRELLDLTKDDTLIWEVYQENGNKYAKVYKK